MNTPETVSPINVAEGRSGEEAPVKEDDDEDVLDEGALRRPRHIRDISMPTQAEVDRHNLTRLPFRNWCPHCMRGRGKEAPHRAVKEARGELPEISLDFCSPAVREEMGR